MFFKMRYELHYSKGIQYGKDLSELTRFAKTLRCKWTLYKFESSKVKDILREYNQFGEEGIEGAIRMISRGISMEVLGKKFHMTTEGLRVKIRVYENKKRPADGSLVSE